MGIWDTPMRDQTRQKLVTLRRPYTPPDDPRKGDVDSFPLHFNYLLHPFPDALKEIGDGLVVSHTYAIYEGMEIFTLVVIDE